MDDVAQALADHFTAEAPQPRPPSLAQAIDGLATAMAALPLQETSGEAFHRLAGLRARAEGVSLAEAYRRQSESTPELWQDVRAAQPRGY
jgi:hypothetical protein